MSGASNDKIYELLNDLRKEIKQDITTMGTGLAAQVGKIDQKLDDMEDKRLAPLEKEVTQLKVSQATTMTKLGVLGFIGASVMGALISIGTGKLWR